MSVVTDTDSASWTGVFVLDEDIVNTQASLNVARRSVRATFATFKNLGRPILGSGPVSDPGFMA
jgi:hypothetical protein